MDQPVVPLRHRPLLLPVLIATVFLVVIGASVGLVLRDRAARRAAGPTATAGTEPPGATPTARGTACRPETQRQAQRAGAAGTVSVALYVRTATSAVWICRDTAGRLYYHANRRTADDRWVEGETALFLAGVRSDGDGYRATSVDSSGRATTFTIDRRRLRILHRDGRVEDQPVVSG